MNSHSLVRVLGTMALMATPLGHAQGQSVDARWRAWAGCWTPVPTTSASAMSKAGTVCVVPAQGTSAVDIISVSGSAVVDRTHIDADGRPHEISRDGCSGTETARWASTGTRVYLSQDVLCTGGIQRRVSGVMSFDQRHQWLDVRGISSGESQGVAVMRYEALADSTGLPAEVLPAFRLRGPAANAAILAASAPLTLRDIADVATRTDSGVTAAWLMERTRGVQLHLNGAQLTQLADAGVPSSVIDVLVAISYPQNFALGGSGDAVERPATAVSRTVRGYRGYGGYPAYWYDPYFGPWSYYYDPFYYGYGPGYGGYYGYGYNSPYYGYYYPGTPTVVVNNPPGGSAGSTPHGRVVKGRGYTSGSSSPGGSSATWSPPAGESSSAAGSPSSSSGGSAGGSSGSSSPPRTAVRKPPL